MTNNEFVEKLRDCAINYPTKYRNGKIGQYENGYFLFDCICFIKSILWGWKGDKESLYGGATYASNGVPDQTLDWFLNKCSEVSTNFNNIEIGEYLWMNGHCGIYIGDGLAVECTPAFLNKVLFTAVTNIGNKTGYGGRKWSKHGKLPFIEYLEEQQDSIKENNIEINGNENKDKIEFSQNNKPAKKSIIKIIIDFIKNIVKKITN